MKKINIYLSGLLSIILLFSCTPKVSQEIGSNKTGTSEPMTPGDESWRTTAPTPAPAPAFNLGEYKDFQLNNGLKVIVVQNHKLPVVSYQLFVDRGPLKEGNIAGISSITGQMMQSGSENRTKEEIDEKLDFIAATLSTSSSGFYASSLKKHSDELLEIATDLLYHPSFPESEFNRIIQNTLSGLAFQKSSPNAIAANVGNAVVYGKEHAYGEFTTEETVKTISLDDVRAFYQNYFFPDAAYLIVVGDISVDEARNQSEKYFGDWERKPDFKRTIPPFVESPQGNTVSFINKDGSVQSVLTVEQTTKYKPNATDRLAVEVMNTLLGGYFGSRLNKNIREDKGYTYGIRSSMSPDLYVGSFSISASVRNAVTDSTLTEVFKEIEKIRNTPVDTKELELVKNVKTGQFARGLEQPQTIAQYALNIARYNLPKDYYETYLSRLEKLTPQDVQQAAQKYLNPSRMHVIVVGSEADVASHLVSFDHNGEIDFYDTKANKIDKQTVEGNMDDGLDDMKAETVIEHYLQAAGGREKLAAVKSFKQSSLATTPMGDVKTTIEAKDNTKVHMKIEASGMVVQEITFNGMKAKVAGAQGSQEVTDPSQFERFREMADFAKELDYTTTDRFIISYVGKEDIDGKTAYKIQIKKSDGTTSIEFYDIDSGLKLKEIVTVEANGQQFTTTQEFADYQNVEGIMIPMETTLSGGGMPFEMVTKVEDVQINPDISDDVFVIE